MCKLQQISFNNHSIRHFVVSVYAVSVTVMESMVQYREMCYGISICNVCNGDGVYGTV